MRSSVNHVDDREAAGGAVVGVDLGARSGAGERAAAAHLPRAAEGGPLGRRIAAATATSERLTAGQPVRRRLAGEIRIVDPEAVQHQPVGQRVDLRRADLQAVAGQRPGELVENARR